MKAKKAKKTIRPMPDEPVGRPVAEAASLRLPPGIALALLVVISLGASWLVHFKHLPYWQRHEALLFHDEYKPLMTTLDAYYYLRLTSDFLEGRYEPVDEKRPGAQRPSPVPLLVSLTALAHRITGAGIDLIGFYIPPLLASLMIPAYFLWGRALGGPTVAVFAVLAGISSFYWYSRTCLGRFDTDALNPFFILLMSYTLYEFSIRKEAKRYLFLGMMVFLGLLFCLWWIQAGYISLILVLVPYCSSLFIPSSRVEKYIKIGMLSLGALAVLAMFLGVYSYFPRPLAGLFELAAGQVSLVTKGATSAFPEIGQSISELQTPGLGEIVDKVSSHGAPFAIALLGLVALAWKERRGAALFLAPSLLLSLGVLFSRRFLIFFVPLYALGFGYFMAEVVLKNAQRKRMGNHLLRYSLVGGIAVLLLVPGFRQCLSTPVVPADTARDVAMAEAIREDAAAREPGASGSIVWTWWDNGYFIQYFANGRTFADGGSQSPERTFITAFPLSCEDPVLARNWIRFFAVRDLDGLARVQEKLGGMDKAVAFLKEVLARPERSEAILEAFGFDDPASWGDYLFPDQSVYLYLGNDFVDKAYWWYYFGTWNFTGKEGIHPRLVMFRPHEVTIDEKAGVIMSGGQAIKLGKILHVSETNITISDLHREEQPIAVKVENGPTVYAMDKDLFRSLAVKLMFLGPSSQPGFESVFYHPLSGGVWRVDR